MGAFRRPDGTRAATVACHAGQVRTVWILGLAASLSVAGCGPGQPPAPSAGTAPVTVLATHSHDRAAFTQGLFVEGNLLYESTGLHGESWVRVSELRTGRQIAKQSLPPEYFGEGITLAAGRLWQLTWQDKIAFERDPDTLAERRRVSYAGEGWGLCTRANTIVMSDGSSRLTFRDPVTFGVTRTVSLQSRKDVRLNELDCAADGSVYANAWPTDHILRIDPDTGAVLADYDLSGVIPAPARAGGDVLNGIAQLPGTDRFLITGKHWGAMFEVKFGH